jgi:hypothetical protein
MPVLRCLVVFLGLLPLSALAADPQPIRVIPKSYVSPGAQGSVQTESWSQTQERVGGHALPAVPGRYQGHEVLQEQRIQGGLRQSVEYPGGVRIQTQPGSSQERYQRQR